MMHCRYEIRFKERAVQKIKGKPISKKSLHVDKDGDGKSDLNGCRTNKTCNLVERAIQNEKAAVERNIGGYVMSKKTCILEEE